MEPYLLLHLPTGVCCELFCNRLHTFFESRLDCVKSRAEISSDHSLKGHCIEFGVV